MLSIFTAIQSLMVCIARRHMKQLRIGPSEIPPETVRRHWKGVINIGLLCVMIIVSWIVGCFSLLWFLVKQPPISDPDFALISIVAAFLNVPHGIWLPVIWIMRLPQLQPVYAHFRRSLATCRHTSLVAPQT
jgi:hypothetical protein